ncbi:MAG: HAD family hydrolase [Thermoplasmata archaeon]|nr:HAD family hydrolase [Thermoplasmata archaeon]
MTVRAVFLDFGGTLVSDWGGVYPVFEAAFRSLGRTIDRATFDRAERAVEAEIGRFEDVYLGRPPGFADEYHGRILDRIDCGIPTSRIIDALNRETSSPESHRPFPETIEVLGTLRRRGLPLHLVSNNTEHLFETLRRLGWGEWFESVTYSQEAGAAKPDPRIFGLALDRAGRAPGEAVHVGDRWDADILGARAAGIPAVWVERSGQEPPRDGPRVRDLRGVLSYLDSGTHPASPTDETGETAMAGRTPRAT